MAEVHRNAPLRNSKPKMPIKRQRRRSSVEERFVNVDVNVFGIRGVVPLRSRRQRRERQSRPLGRILGTAVTERAARALPLGSAPVAAAAHNGGQPGHRS